MPILEAGSGLRAGADFHLGYSPERIDPSNPTWGLQNTPKIVSGVDEASAAAVAAFYDNVVDRTVPAPGTREAELAKLLENTFRHVNIALVNELADVLPRARHRRLVGDRHGGDEAVRLHAVHAGPRRRRALPADRPVVPVVAGAPGARAAPSGSSRSPTTSTTTCRATSSPGSIEHLNRRRLAVNGSRVLLVGLTYKRNSGDARQSPAIAVARRLADLGAELSAASTR